MTFSSRVYEEPLGLIRILQCIFAIIAFSTTAGYSNSLTLILCGDQHVTEEIKYEYPFTLAIENQKIVCNETVSGNFTLVGDHSTSAEFFVAIGVISFLYSGLAVLLYAFYEQIYLTSSSLPKSDFLISLILSIFWISASIAWSNGLADIKFITDANVIENMEICETLDCVQVFSGSFSALNISVIIGFLSFILWIGSLWFVYKETLWFRLSSNH